MKAAIVKKAGTYPVYSEFKEPITNENEVKVQVKAVALSNLTKNASYGKSLFILTRIPIGCWNRRSRNFE
jgi:Zn-dependent alcohol dehydrogenases